MSEKQPSQLPRNRYFYYAFGAGVGAIVGWMALPPEFQSIGLSVGAAIGIFVMSIWSRWQFNKRSQETEAGPLGFGGHLFYLLTMILCLYMICQFGESWLANPAKWGVEIMGMLFFGAAGIGAFVFWAADSHFVTTWLTEARINMVLGLVSIVFALGAGFVIALGNVLWGVTGIVFFAWCGIALLKKSCSR